MCNNRKIYKDLIDYKSLDLSSNPKYRIFFRNRFLHCKKEILKTGPVTHYAYIILDFDREKIDRDNLYKKNDDLNSDISEQIKHLGKFILLSNFDLDEKDVLNYYYTREHIEQIFDISKNNASMLPLRTHKTESTMGHLLLSFIASIISLELNNKLKNSKFCAHGALQIMNDISVIFNDDLSTVDPLMTTEKELAVILDLNLDYPIKVDLNKSYTNKYLNKYHYKRKKGRPKGRKNMINLCNNDTTLDNESDNIDNSVHKNNFNNTKARRGRPIGSKNKPKIQFRQANNEINNDKPKRGRPLGSKNKSK
jgi:hypothetical protein